MSCPLETLWQPKKNRVRCLSGTCKHAQKCWLGADPSAQWSQTTEATSQPKNTTDSRRSCFVPPGRHAVGIFFTVGKAAPLDQCRTAQQYWNDLAVDHQLGDALVIRPATDGFVIGGCRFRVHVERHDEIGGREPVDVDPPDDRIDIRPEKVDELLDRRFVLFFRHLSRCTASRQPASSGCRPHGRRQRR